MGIFCLGRSRTLLVVHYIKHVDRKHQVTDHFFVWILIRKTRTTMKLPRSEKVDVPTVNKVEEQVEEQEDSTYGSSVEIRKLDYAENASITMEEGFMINPVGINCHSSNNGRAIWDHPKLAPAYSAICLFSVAVLGVVLGLIIAPHGSGNPNVAVSGSYRAGALGGTPNSCGLNLAPTGPTPYLVESAKNRSIQFDRMVNPRLFKLVKNHTAFETMLESYEPEESWKQSHIADVNIFGIAKAGTSQLYKILTSHPEMRTFHQHQEFCYNIGDDVVGTVINHLDVSTVDEKHEMQKEMRRANDGNDDASVNGPWYSDWKNLNQNTTQGHKTVNKCLDSHKFFWQRQYLNAGTKIIVLLRDPADWLWAVWNFWIRPQHEDRLPAYRSNWASSPNQYRSPELFHELMLSADQFWPSHTLLEASRTPVEQNLRILAETVNPSDVLVLKTEDMYPENIDSSGFLEKLAKFLDVSQDGFDASILHSYVNCGDNKGTSTECETASSAYAIAGNRPMLEKTRELVYLHFAEDCKMWDEVFGITYGLCLAVREKYVASG